MEYKKIDNKFIVRIDKGEEIVAQLLELCKKENIRLGTVTGIGATNKLTIGLFETESKTYISKTIEGDFEIAPLSGNITTMNSDIYLHLHINVCDVNNRSYGGHLNSAIVSATFECVIEKFPNTVNRKFSDEIGLNLLDFE